MKKCLIVLMCCFLATNIFCSCNGKATQSQNSSYVDIDKFEDSTDEDIIPSVPDSKVNVPDDWK